MKNAIRNLFMIVALAVLAMPAFAQRGPGDGGTGGPQPPSKGAMYYLTNDSCRTVLESKMSTEDAAALEAAIADFRSADKSLQDLRLQMEAAMRTGDTALLAQLQLQAQGLQQQQGTDLATIDSLLAKYQADADLVMRDCHPGKPGGDPGDKGGRGRGHGGDKGGPGGHGPNPHVRIEAGFFLGHDSCRWALEAKMTTEDAQDFEAATLALKADGQSIRDLMKQLRDAMRAHDSATVTSLRDQLRAAQEKIRADRDAYMQILTKYADQIGAVHKECWSPRRSDGGRGDKSTEGGNIERVLKASPIFPNPVNYGGDGTLNYELTADAQVNIILTDAMGTVVQQLTNDAEVAGKYTVTIKTAGLQTGTYYLRIQAGTDVQTQKISVVQ
jgi:hypothetical protein